ncbi:carboxymuconolactone decarboxylase family protein [Streptomyces flaveus]|uniref:Carboxymuconolactone decarboxylase-like domain-containing protein n=1 Tax=Streptomyces flaveus TaxID=66370 RepID=A0A917VAY2_9ACTN|nr:carboxymuconolactone decarboxylase family protein [Streptomyces flaveus]GGK59378.1 hypothetical protein GCM10010094_19610 [Streptomyces flaveus]
MEQTDPLKDTWAVRRAVLGDAYVDAAAAPRAGVTQEELGELPFQIAAYCGAPAGVAARRGLAETEEVRDAARRAASDGARGGD